MYPQAVEKLCNFYQSLRVEDVSHLGEIYHEDVTFTDPVHSVNGLSQLKQYFSSICSDEVEYRFDIDNVVVSSCNTQAFLQWVMHYSHPKLSSNRPLQLIGSSVLRYDERVQHQQDYYDLGAMIYEHIPVMGWCVKRLKERLELKHEANL